MIEKIYIHSNLSLQNDVCTFELLPPPFNERLVRVCIWYQNRLLLSLPLILRLLLEEKLSPTGD